MALPMDKEYHLFLSHSSPDEPDVIPILNILESEPYNLKCYIDRRDFMAGETTMANINHALGNSAATVFFLTPNFIESSYCNHEKDIAYSMFMEGGGRVIPVILKPCCLPDEFRNIHYIDDAFPESIAEKIFKCLTTDRKDYKRLLPLPPIQAGNDRKNGSHFTFDVLDALEKKQGECFVSTAEKLKFNRIGIQPTDEKLLMILNMLKSLPLDKKCYKLTSVKRYLILTPFLWSFACVAVFNLPIQLLDMSELFYKNHRFDNNNNGYVTYMTATFSAPAIFLIWVAAVITLLARRRMEIRTSIKKLRLVNKLAIKDMCCYFNINEPWVLQRQQFSVIKYDIAECKIYMKRSWSEKYTDIDDVDGFEFEDIWNEIVNQIRGAFDMYFTHIGQENLSLVEESRHFVQNHKICFCEYFDQVTSFEEVICKKLDEIKKELSCEHQNHEEDINITV